MSGRDHAICTRGNLHFSFYFLIISMVSVVSVVSMVPIFSVMVVMVLEQLYYG